MMQTMNYSMPPPPMGAAPSVGNQFQSLQFKPFKPSDGEFDGKRLRKSVMRKTVDYNSSVVQMLEARIWQRDSRDRPSLPADISFASHLQPPPAYLTNPTNAVVTKFVRTSTNKAKCPIFCLAWTPEGRRLVTGASSGEFTLWNGLTFNFETILQAHDKSVREMVWSHNDQWMVTGDTDGYVKYWQSNMNNVKTFQAHKDPVRGLSFCPNDLKLASGSDDGTVRIWDFYRCQEERTLKGHGADVKCVAWHPSKCLIASGSKDNQQPIKLWDPRTGTSLAKLHAHKGTVMDLKWNGNGNWLCSASRDHLLKLFDVRNFSTELQVFRGHKKEASCIAWHPQHEGMFASGGSDGSILFWHVGNDKEIGMIESAHDGIIWDLAWHPLGHILCSGSNDHASKFWTRNRLGDKMRDKYNLNTLPPGVIGDDCVDIDDIPIPDAHVHIPCIPGMGPDDKVEAESAEPKKGPEVIPGLEFDGLALERFLKKTPYAKPIPKTFQASWNAAGGLDENVADDQSVTSWVIVQSGGLFCKPADIDGEPVITDAQESLPPGSIPLEDITADAIAYYGFYIPLPMSTGQAISDAFSFGEEEDALTTLTDDPEFARKLIREKKGLYNPAANPGFEDVKQERQHNDSQVKSEYRNRNRRDHGSRDAKNYNNHRSAPNSHQRYKQDPDQRGARRGRSPTHSSKPRGRGGYWDRGDDRDQRNRQNRPEDETRKHRNWTRDDREEKPANDRPRRDNNNFENRPNWQDNNRRDNNFEGGRRPDDNFVNNEDRFRGQGMNEDRFRGQGGNEDRFRGQGMNEERFRGQGMNDGDFDNVRVKREEGYGNFEPNRQPAREENFANRNQGTKRNWQEEPENNTKSVRGGFGGGDTWRHEDQRNDRRKNHRPEGGFNRGRGRGANNNSRGRGRWGNYQ